MKILAIDGETESTTPDVFQPHLRSEDVGLWELHRACIVRRLYLQHDRSDAVLMLECVDLAAAHRAPTSLPLVAGKPISFDPIPLKPYPGFLRFFCDKGK